MPYTFIEHTADEGIDVSAPTLSQLFESAAAGFCDLICDRETIQAKEERTIILEKSNIEELLQGFLSELLYLFETEYILFSQVKIDSLEEKKLKARVYGEKIDPSRHEIKTGVKAVTYHQLKIEKVGEEWRGRVIFDV